MRLVIAALSFFIGLFAFIRAFMALLPADAPGWQIDAAIVAGFLLSLFLTNKLVNAPGTRFWSLSRAPEPDESPEQEGLLVSTAYRAKRYFEVEASDEEGPHYFIELDDGSVLYMSGRYLAAFRPRKIFNLIDYPRKFPCTEFIVKRDRCDGCIVDIQCSGSPLEPEIVTPPFNELAFQSSIIPQDGDILVSRTYDAIKSVRSSQVK
jgi:hypothetical protein